MENKEELLKKLNSDDVETVKEAIEGVKTDGDLSIVPELLKILTPGKDHHITTELVGLLADIKDNSFRNVLIDAIGATKNPEIKALLLRVVWESALDYSAYAVVFAEIMVAEEFIVALEASTVLEELGTISNDDRITVLKTLRAAKVSEEKQFLIDNVLSLLAE